MNSISENYYTSTFSNIITRVLLGHNTYSLTSGSRYLYVYNKSCKDLRELYETNDQNINRMQQVKPVIKAQARILDSLYNTENKTHSASLVTTLNGADLDKTIHETEEYSLALVINSNIFVITPFSVEAYEKLRDGLRVDIEWNITVSSNKEIQGVAE